MSADDLHEAHAEFEIIDWQEEPYDEPAEGPKLSRATVTKRYRGQIEGGAVAQMLTAQGEGGAGYVASERIAGTLAGRRGSFVLQHGGLLDGELRHPRPRLGHR